MPKLTAQEGLDAFWNDPPPPCAETVKAFLSYLKRTSQLNGGFHSKAARALLVPRLAQTLAQDALVRHVANAARDIKMPRAAENAASPPVAVHF